MAKPVLDPACVIAVGLNLGLALLLLVSLSIFRSLHRLLLLAVEDGPLSDQDLVALAVRGWREELHVVADLSLETDVGDKTALGECVDAWLVAGIGVAIGVAVGDLEEDQDVVAVGNRLRGVHGWIAPVECEVTPFRGKDHVGQSAAASASAFFAMCSFRSFSLRAFCWWKP